MRWERRFGDGRCCEGRFEDRRRRGRNSSFLEARFGGRRKSSIWVGERESRWVGAVGSRGWVVDVDGFSEDCWRSLRGPFDEGRSIEAVERVDGSETRRSVWERSFGSRLGGRGSGRVVAGVFGLMRKWRRRVRRVGS